VRAFLTLLLALICAAAACGQARMATVTLDDGTTLRGAVIRLDVREVLLDVDGTVEAIPATRIRSCRFEPARSTGPAGAGTAAVPTGSGSRGPSSGRLLDARLDRVRAVYPWIVPREPLHWVSAGITLLFGFGFGVHLAARFGGAEGARWRRGFVVAAFLMAIVAANVALVPMALPVAAVAAAGSLLAGILIMRIGYGLGFGGSLVALISVAIEVAVGGLVILLVDAVLRSIGSDVVS
jgi:hypothetical protein